MAQTNPHLRFLLCKNLKGIFFSFTFFKKGKKKSKVKLGARDHLDTMDETNNLAIMTASQVTITRYIKNRNP